MPGILCCRNVRKRGLGVPGFRVEGLGVYGVGGLKGLGFLWL